MAAGRNDNDDAADADDEDDDDNRGGDEDEENDGCGTTRLKTQRAPQGTYPAGPTMAVAARQKR